MSQYNNMYEAFGSPMLGSTLVTAPRRDGDGMDKESLQQQAVSPTSTKSGNLHGKTRHQNLNSTVGVQRVDVDRVKGQKRIEHEPVRGAVRAVLPSGGQQKDSNIYVGQNTQEKDSCQQLSINLTHTDIRVSGMPNKLVVPPVTAVQEMREVEGQGQIQVTSDQETERLYKSVDDLQEQLKVQSKVNTDLKKLLVASMGDDLHHKVDTLVRTKAQLACDIGGYTDRIHEDHETLDKLAIQADIWRSKYNGSRVLIDQLAHDKDVLSRQWSDAERALQLSLQEREQLWDCLLETHRYLKLLRDSFDPVGSRRSSATIPNILELARTNHLLADSIKFRLLPAMPVFPSALDVGIQNGASPAERLARQVLSMDTKPEVSGSSLNLVRLSPNNKFDRFHPQVRYENITFNCCAKCKGEVHVV